MKMLPANEAHRLDAAAFTLLEVLLVISLIAALAAGLGRAWWDRSRSGLATAQHLVGTLLSQARATAVARQTETRLVVFVGSLATDSGNHLRMLQVLHADAAGTSEWMPSAEPQRLPRGFIIVPPASPGSPVGTISPAASQLTIGTTAGLPIESTLRAASRILFMEFRPDGSFQPGDIMGGGRVVVARDSGDSGTSVPTRSILIRPNGSVVLPEETVFASP
jgi:type II secretory pathway pseudopilin PulG